MTETRQVRKSRELRRRPLERGGKSVKYRGIREWQTELSVSRLFGVSIRLQTVFDHRFNPFGMTAQEAAVLLRCVEEGQTYAGKLAKLMSRDKGKITRFVDRLEAGGFLARKSHPQDRRLQIIRATRRGQRIAPQLRARFDEIRSQF